MDGRESDKIFRDIRTDVGMHVRESFGSIDGAERSYGVLHTGREGHEIMERLFGDEVAYRAAPLCGFEVGCAADGNEGFLE